MNSNQSAIVAALRAAGATVRSLAELGHGIPDLLVGWRGVNYLVEVKNLDGKGDSLTDDEKEFHGAWRGQVCIVRTVNEALHLLNHPPWSQQDDPC